MDKDTLVKVGTLGGKVRINHNNLWMYGQDNGGLTKERLFGMRGPIHLGMKQRNMEVAVGASQSDTKQTLIRELTNQSHMTRREAEEAVNELIRSGALEEVNDPTLGKVLIVRRR